jgi:hypothetical protein
MIRSGFWLTAGVVTGIYAYRRASALGRRISATLNPPGTGAPARLASERTRRAAVALAIQTIRFTRDVREGMELYTARHSASEGSTLGAPDLTPGAPDLTPGARDLESARISRTNHNPQPKDGR